jgi:hypothetical protein
MADETDREALRSYVAYELRLENIWTKLWSGVHHGFLFGAAILSAAAALLLQLQSLSLQDAQKADIASVLAAAASLIGVISISGGFGKKWRTNRMTKATLEQLQIDLMDRDCDLVKVREALKEMKRAHHMGVVDDASADKGAGVQR